MKSVLITLFALLLCSTPLMAGDFPQTLDISILDANETKREIHLTYNGQGRCVWGLFRWKLYDIALYMEQPSTDPNTVIHTQQIKRFEQRFLRKMKPSHLERAYRCAFEANAGAEATTLQQRIDDLCKLLPTVNKGDTLIFTLIPGKGTAMSLGEQPLGLIPGNDFIRMFITLYVGSHPPTEAVRAGLLGNTPP